MGLSTNLNTIKRPIHRESAFSVSGSNRGAKAVKKGVAALQENGFLLSNIKAVSDKLVRHRLRYMEQSNQRTTTLAVVPLE